MSDFLDECTLGDCSEMFPDMPFLSQSYIATLQKHFHIMHTIASLVMVIVKNGLRDVAMHVCLLSCVYRIQ